jgi:hypothetical protein
VAGLLALSLIGIAAALVRGGSFAGWARVHVRWSGVALASLALLLLLHNHPIDRLEWAIAWGPAIWTICLAVLCAVLVRNALADKALRGPWAVAALGVALNVLVVAANGGFMPQSVDARLTSRGTPIQDADIQLKNVRPMTEETRLNFLGDVIPEPAWLPKTNVISIGDLLLGFGLAWWAFAVTRRRSIA